MKMEYVWMVVCPLIGIAIISFLSRKLSARTAFIVTALLFIAMAASGIAKQIIAIATGYDLWYLPLHFSSTFYIPVGVSVFAHGKAEHAAQAILFVGGIIMCAMILVRPAAILGNLSGVFTSHIHAHGYFYHMLVVLQFGIMLARGNYRPKRHDPLFFAGGVALWGAVAIPCAFVFNANYMGILHAYIPFLEQFRIKFGYAPYLIVYYLGAVLLATLLIYGYGFLRKKLAKKA